MKAKDKERLMAKLQLKQRKSDCFYCDQGSPYCEPPNENWHETQWDTFAQCQLKPKTSFDPSLLFPVKPERRSRADRSADAISGRDRSALPVAGTEHER